MHKKTFSLETGECLSGEEFSVLVFPVKVDGDDVYLHLPPKETLDRKDLQRLLLPPTVQAGT